MPASLISSLLPSLPLRRRTHRRVAAIAITRNSAAATARLTQNSQTKPRSNRSSSLVSDSMNAITSAEPITASSEIARAQRSALLMPGLYTGSAPRRLDHALVDAHGARDAERPVVAQPDLQRLRQLGRIEPVAEFQVVALSGFELAAFGQWPAADARQHRHRVGQRGITLAERPERDAPIAGERLERQPVAARHARHAFIAPVPARAEQGGLDIEVHRHAAAQRVFNRAREREPRAEFECQCAFA